jgi:hypothetical protein
MPIYEFYCGDCNTLYSFFSATIDTATLTRSTDSGGEDEDDPFAALDERQMEAAMASLEQELGGLDEENPDPRHLANALRKVGQATGLEMGPKMEEMLSQLESGADPDSLEDEMGDLDGSDDSFDEFFRLKKKAAALKKRPRVDEELYFF